jgi:hypothetical protein
MKFRIIWSMNEHTWSWLPTLQTWKNDFRGFGMGIHRAITIKWFNKTVGLNIENDRKVRRR